MMEISASLHNSLVILICIILLVLIFFIGLKQCRRVWRQIHMIYNGQRNVVALDSAEVHDLIDTLCTVNDTIPIHPRQIRRILRKLLDANVVKEIACSQPTLHLKQPHFYKHDERKQYIVKLNAHQRAPPSSLLLPVLNNNSNVLNNSGSSPQRIFDFYFGVPKHYYFQLKSITKSCQKSAIFQREQKKQIYQAVPTQSFMHQSHASLASTSQVQRTMMTSPLESIIGFAATRVQPAIQRMHSSSSLGSKSEMDDVDIIMDVEKRRRVSGADAASGAAVDEGIEMAEIVRIPQTQTQTQTQNAKATSLSMMSMMSLSSTMSLLPQSSQLTLQRLIPNEFVLRERIECKDDEEQLSFDERDLESTINAIIAIGNNGGHRSRNVLQKKHGPPTKYKRHRSSADVAAATGRARDRDEKTQEEDEDDTSVDGNAFYFCALLSYVRYPITEQQQEQKEDEDAAEQKHMHMDDEEEEEEEKRDERQPTDSDDDMYEAVGTVPMDSDGDLVPGDDRMRIMRQQRRLATGATSNADISGEGQVGAYSQQYEVNGVNEANEEVLQLMSKDPSKSMLNGSPKYAMQSVAGSVDALFEEVPLSQRN
mmetsp:Transcript_52967/g.87757  ORF Transcript_52967/g.87757 Transcript_52967/m.87757 type:complete len:595 (+) Transcript_52967:34-1818(+)